MSTAVVLASARADVADFVNALITVYVILIIIHIVAGMFFSFGGRVPYSRPLNAVLEFLGQTCEPLLRQIRRFLPMFGPLDLSPMVAIIGLELVGGVLVSLIRG